MINLYAPICSTIATFVPFIIELYTYIYINDKSIRTKKYKDKKVFLGNNICWLLFNLVLQIHVNCRTPEKSILASNSLLLLKQIQGTEIQLPGHNYKYINIFLYIHWVFLI